MSENEKFVIIGASHAGVQLAVSLRETGFAGSITLVSDEVHTPYHRPPLSKGYLKDINLSVQVLRAESYYGDNDIQLIKPHRAINIELNNARVELDNGKKLPFSSLCLATGARPRTLDIPGIGASGVYQLRNADNAQILRQAARSRKRAVVVGGGFIGLEAAATLHGLGMDVSVVEAEHRLMGRAVAPEISGFVLDSFRTLGIKVFLDTPITQIETENGAAAKTVTGTATKTVRGVVCGDHHFPADMVLIGIGVVPNDELAGEAGLQTGDGIHVDENMRTSAGNVFAIGDVAAYEHWLAGQRIRLESVQNATDQARNVANTIAGNVQPYRAVPWFWSEQADMKIQMVGLSHNSKTRIIRENPERASLTAFHFDDQDKLVAIDTINAPGDHMAGRILIAKGISPTREQAGDINFPLKNML